MQFINAKMNVTFLIVLVTLAALANSQKQGQVCRRTPHVPEEENQQKCPKVYYVTSDDDEGDMGEKGAKGARGRNGHDIRLSIDDIAGIDISILNRLIDEELKKYNLKSFNFHQNIDECALKAHNCSINARCEDTLESFTCSCNAGYSGNGLVCEDIDECALNTSGCRENTACKNTQGNYTCECDNGYSGDGVLCIDIDECSLNTDNCSTSASCINTQGNFTCNCNAGYSGDGTTCTDIDECSLNTDNCSTSASCINTQGNFTCNCNSGYSGDGFACTVSYCPVGLSDSSIVLDDDFSASSVYGRGYFASDARFMSLNPWYPELPFKPEDWLQVDLKKEIVITGVITQGEINYWTKTFKISYGINSGDEQFILGSDGLPKVFQGNQDGVNKVTNRFESSINARYIRLTVLTFPEASGPALRLEYLKC